MFVCPKFIRYTTEKKEKKVCIDIRSFRLKHKYNDGEYPKHFVLEAKCSIRSRKVTPKQKIKTKLDGEYVDGHSICFIVGKVPAHTQLVMTLTGTIDETCAFEEDVILVRLNKSYFVKDGKKYRISDANPFEVTYVCDIASYSKYKKRNEKIDSRLVEDMPVEKDIEDTLVEKDIEDTLVEKDIEDTLVEKDIEDETMSEESKHENDDDSDPDFVIDTKELELCDDDFDMEECPTPTPTKPKKNTIIDLTSSHSAISGLVASPPHDVTALSPMSFVDRSNITVVNPPILPLVSSSSSNLSEKELMEAEASRAADSSSLVDMVKKNISSSIVPPFVRQDTDEPLKRVATVEERNCFAFLDIVNSARFDSSSSCDIPILQTSSFPSLLPVVQESASLPFDQQELPIIARGRRLWSIPELYTKDPNDRTEIRDQIISINTKHMLASAPKPCQLSSISAPPTAASLAAAAAAAANAARINLRSRLPSSAQPSSLPLPSPLTIPPPPPPPPISPRTTNPTTNTTQTIKTTPPTNTNPDIETCPSCNMNKYMKCAGFSKCHFCIDKDLQAEKKKEVENAKYRVALLKQQVEVSKRKRVEDEELKKLQEEEKELIKLLEKTN
jgi:hypothetical protein